MVFFLIINPNKLFINKTVNTMKQIKLTENELRAKIAECVTNALQGFNEEIQVDNGEWFDDGEPDADPVDPMNNLESGRRSHFPGMEVHTDEDGEEYGIDDDGNKWVLDDYGKPIMASDEIAGLDEAKQLIKKMVKEALFVADNGITFDSSDGYENDWDQESLAEDAKEMLEMSDGMCDYNEWEDAFPDMDTDIKIDAWNQACQELGYDNLMVNYQMQEMRETVEKLVRESFNTIDMTAMMPQQYNYDQQEVKRSSIAKAKERAIKKSKETDTHSHNKMVKKNTKDDEKRSGKAGKGKRAIVLTWLKDPAVNCAEIMRKLWNPTEEEEDAARSYFYKCRDGKLNDSGVPYKFSDSDINSLYKIKSEKSA